MFFIKSFRNYIYPLVGQIWLTRELWTWLCFQRPDWILRCGSSGSFAGPEKQSMWSILYFLNSHSHVFTVTVVWMYSYSIHAFYWVKERMRSKILRPLAFSFQMLCLCREMYAASSKTSLTCSCLHLIARQSVWHCSGREAVEWLWKLCVPNLQWYYFMVGTCVITHHKWINVDK